jgi:hypothetical protein
MEDPKADQRSSMNSTACSDELAGHKWRPVWSCHGASFKGVKDPEGLNLLVLFLKTLA